MSNNAYKHSTAAKLGLRRLGGDPRLVYAKDQSTRKTPGWGGFVDDTFAAMLDGGDSTELDEPNRLAKKLGSLARENPNWDRLQDSASYHPIIAAKATAGIAQVIYEMEEDEIEQDQDQEHNDDDGDDEKQSPEGCPGSPTDGEGEPNFEKIARMHHMTKHLADEMEEQAQKVEALRGIGLLATDNDGADPIDEDMINAMGCIEDLSEFIDQLGAGKKMEGDGTSFGVCDVVGVDKGSDIERLLPTEIGLLCDDDLSFDLMKRLTEDDAWVYEVEDKTSSAGDFILMVDRSGSMASHIPNGKGDRMQWARSVALSTIKNCLNEDRSVVLVLFAGFGDVDSIRIDSKADMKNAVTKILERPRGGTNISGAFEAASEIVKTESERFNDLVVITDGHVPMFERGEWLNGKLTCVSISENGNRMIPAYLEEKFDEVFMMRDEDLSVGNVRRVVGKC